MTNVRATVTLVGRSTDADGWERDEWDVTLRYDGRELATKFYTGTLHGLPTVDDVMASLFSDAQGVEYDGFEDWAGNYGYDDDSRKAHAIYERILEQTERLKEFCGIDYDAMQNEAFAEING